MSSSSLPSSPRVFISYSHDSDEHALRVLQLADALRAGGIDAWLDQYDPWPSQGWPQWMTRQVAKADFVLVICTKTYRRRFEQEEAPGSGDGVVWEGAIISSELYDLQGRNDKFLPVVWTEDDRAFIPRILRGATQVVDPLAPTNFEALYRRLTDQPASPAPPLGSLRSLTSPARLSFRAASENESGIGWPSALETYRQWALNKYEHFELVGLDAEDVKLSFDEVYVPLRFDERTLPHLHTSKLEDTGWRHSEKNLELDRIFLRRDAHVVIWGEPGMGKTTALLKLHQLCWILGPAALGLPEATVPIFLRLRRLKAELVEAPLLDFICRELDELSNGVLGEAEGKAVWNHGHLLLLLDGLDEIGDARDRRRVWDHVEWCLRERSAAGCRAVVTCRIEGWPQRLEPGEGWLRFGVRPFDDEQIQHLVELFFRYAPRAFPRISAGVAEQRARLLVAGLKEQREGEEGHRLIVMAATPLLLTLLCIVVLRGNEIPRRRALFYDRCLEILLGRWRKESAEREPPIPTQLAKTLLADLAFYLQERKRRDDLEPIEALLRFAPRLANYPEGKDVEVFEWLLRDAGLLTCLSDDHYGFLHLNLQEYLAACYLADDEERLREICAFYADSWWQQVFRLLAGLPGRHAFSVLMSSLLETRALFEKADLLRACLREAAEPDIQPFLEPLRQGDGAKQAAILGLLRGEKDPALLAVVQQLEHSENAEVQALAMEFRPQIAAAGPHALCLLADENWSEARKLEEALAKTDIEIWKPEAGQALSDPKQLLRMQASCRAIALVFREESRLADLVPKFWAYCKNAERWLVLIKGAKPVPEVLIKTEGLRILEVERVDDPSPLRRAFAEARAGGLAILRHQADSAAAATGKGIFQADKAASLAGESSAPPEKGVPVADLSSFVEAVTGETFLLVPGGAFAMGSDGHRDQEKPVRLVTLGSFWLARNPVTNRQYQIYRRANPEAPEPEYWRSERFAEAEQPVVGVSWQEAAAYCAWLSRETGRSMRLPTEAQWEYAARGGMEQREYPWGGGMPDKERLAVFGRSIKQGPALVGSLLAGAGKFGHLDLAGNIWEWCRDAWCDNHNWPGNRAGDPWNPSDWEGRRVLRGGGCWSSSGSLRSAYRYRLRERERVDDVGFRVAAYPENASPD